MQENQLMTEASNPDSLNLDRMSALELAALMNREDMKAVEAVTAILPAIAACIEAAAAALRSGGRLFYIGAGTSGRLGVLDAAECPPTFGTEPSQVQALIAGGPGAILQAVENAEDDREAAYKELKKRGLRKNDFVIGITASGTTPFVLGALEKLAAEGIHTGAIYCNPGAPAEKLAEFPMPAAVGPEVLRGSTRLKAGTASKLILNMISTGVMVAMGHCSGNMMIDVKASNAKLISRKIKMAAELSGAGTEEAEQALNRCGGDMRKALELLKDGKDK